MREALPTHLKDEQVEPPTKQRLQRIVGSALEQSEKTLTLRVSSRVGDAVTERMLALIARRVGHGAAAAGQDEQSREENQKREDHRGHEAPRDKALALLSSFAGLRISEVVGLDVADVRLSARKGDLRVRGKGRDGKDPILAAELLGHGSLDTTRRYALPTQADKAAALNALLTDQ